VFEIGNSLREVRERQGLGYPEIELATKIRAKYIRALEEEDFDSLPGDAYVRGFLRTYSEYLGLDGDVYVHEYASRFMADWREEPRERQERPRVRRRERRLERRAVLLALAGIALVTALVFAAWRYGGGTTAQIPTVGTQQKHQHGAAARQLVLRGVGAGTYVEVRRSRSAGEVVLQGTVGPGEVDKLAGRRFYLLVRRPESLRVTLDGRAVALPAAGNLRVLVTPQRTTRLHG
jgi:cytoskeletal protein RodZ